MPVTVKSLIFKYFVGLVLFLATVGSSAFAAPAPASLDPSFGSLGKIVSRWPDNYMTGAGVMAIQSDGKIVMAGTKSAPINQGGMVVARYNTNGSLDTGFGTNGWTVVSFGTRYENVNAIDIQADGKIVVGGSTQDVQLIGQSNVRMEDFAVFRLNTNGALDTTFDGDGKMSVTFNNIISQWYTELLGALKVAPDGKIVLGGTAIDGGNDDRFILARLNSDGSLDGAFGNGGKVASASLGATNHDRLNDLVVLPDSKIVVVGKIFNTVSSNRIAIKYNENGTPEWVHSQGAPSWPNQSNYLNAITAQPDGKLIVAGVRDSKVGIVRLNADSSVDNTFVSDPALPGGWANSVAVQANGKILMAFTSSAGYGFSLARFNPNGSLDPSFGIGGIATTRIGEGGDVVSKVTVLPDGKIVAGGYAFIFTQSAYAFAIARYRGDSAAGSGSPFDYDGDGRADVSVFRASENKWYVVNSSNSTLVQKVFASAGDISTPADFDGDGKTDFGIFRPSTGQWWYSSSLNNGQYSTTWGQAGDIPRPSDFDGDGKTDFVVYRPSNGVWYRLGSTGAVSILAFGAAEDKPLVGDFDGDGKGDVAVFRPSTGTWWYAGSASGGSFAAINWGQAGDIPMAADYDGDGKTDLAIYRPAQGVWYVFRSSDQSFNALQFGLNGDWPVAADYDGDGKADIAVFRPSNGIWFLQQSTSGYNGSQFGASTDLPTESSFIPYY